jgi:hypothetical protein
MITVLQKRKDKNDFHLEVDGQRDSREKLQNLDTIQVKGWFSKV